MHSTDTILEIDRLLAAGQLSHRKIALRLGVSRGTVNAIARGERALHGRSIHSQPLASCSVLSLRCPGCGYRVHLPCIICRARRFKKARQRLPRAS